MVNVSLPRFDDAPANWRGPEIEAEPWRWLWTLGREELADLDETVRRLDASGQDIATITAADAPLPALAGRLAALQDTMMHGIGFQLIRGFPAERYSFRQAAIAFWCLGAHLGEPVPQNAKGHLLGHVIDLGFDSKVPSARGYQTSEHLPFHCDSGDVAALLCWRTARSGGLSSIVSSTALYNAMARRRPELAAVLMQPTYRDRREEIPEGRLPWYEMPVFQVHRGRLFVQYVRSAIRKAQRFTEVPRVTAEQALAFDTLDSLARDPEFRLDLALQPGDMQFVCNHTILHSRTEFEDHQEPEKRRHLLRLWLGCPNGPAVPDYYEAHQGLTEMGRPGGYLCPGAVLSAPVAVEDGGPGGTARSAERMAAAE